MSQLCKQHPPWSAGEKGPGSMRGGSQQPANCITGEGRFKPPLCDAASLILSLLPAALFAGLQMSPAGPAG